MALIICKECKAQVSDKATCCPKCGAAIVVKSPKYYIWKNKQQMGPFSLDALKGQIEPKTLVWTKSQKQWVKAIELPELRPLLQSQEQTQPNSQVQPVQPSPSPEVKPAQSTPQPQPVEQPQKESSESQENEMEDDIEQKSNKGLILGFVLGFVALIVVAVLCIPQLRFWEDINNGDLLETAYNEGYNCGKQFGNMNRCEELFDVACRTYITDKNKDSEFYKEFQQQFTQGMEAGVKDSPYKGAIEMGNIAGTYNGTVGEFKIKMTLNYSYGYIDGSYTYTKHGNTLNLSGRMDRNQIYLDETTPRGNNSATWTLWPTRDGLEGIMEVHHNGKTHSVKLIRVD